MVSTRSHDASDNASLGRRRGGGKGGGGGRGGVAKQWKKCEDTQEQNEVIPIPSSVMQYCIASDLGSPEGPDVQDVSLMVDGQKSAVRRKRSSAAAGPKRNVAFENGDVGGATGSSNGRRKNSRRSNGNDTEDSGAEDRTSLAKQLRDAEQKVSQRETNKLRLRRDLSRLKEEMANADNAAERLQMEAENASERAGLNEEVLRVSQPELLQRVEDLLRRTDEHRAVEREWREELDSMTRQKESAEDLAGEAERNVVRWQAAAKEQIRQIQRAEAKFKSLEARRAEFRAQTKQCERQAAEHHVAVKTRRHRVKELTASLQSRTLLDSRERQQWQVLVALLFMIFCWLIILPYLAR